MRWMGVFCWLFPSSKGNLGPGCRDSVLICILLPPPPFFVVWGFSFRDVEVLGKGGLGVLG